jgi:hypothetical protein
MRALLITTLVAGALLTACAAQPPKLTDTKWPQVVVSAPKDQMHEKFLATFAATGASIDDSSGSVLQARIPDANAGMAKAFFGCPSCADPYIKTNVIFSTVSDGTQIVVQYWRMIPKHNGSEERMEMNNTSDFNAWQKILWDLRDQYESNNATQEKK